MFDFHLIVAYLKLVAVFFWHWLRLGRRWQCCVSLLTVLKSWNQIRVPG